MAIDGDTIVVGAPVWGMSSSPGWAKIFVRSGTNWSEQAFVEGTYTWDSFGHAVAIDGDTVVIGAYGDDNPSDSGAAYVFIRSGTMWSEQVKIKVDDAAQNDELGRSVAVDGDTAVIGAPRDDLGGGSAYVFTRSGANWSGQQKLISSDNQEGDVFGWSVAVDGDTAVIGARLDDHSGFDDAGSAYIFTRSGTTWTEQQKLIASDPELNGYFGNSVAMDGDRVVIGASHFGDTDTEGAYIFNLSGGVWTEQEKLVSTQAGDDFGFSVAIERDWVLVGAPKHRVSLFYTSGAAFVFEYEAAPPALPFSDGFESGDTSGWSVTVGGTIESVVIPFDDALEEYRVDCRLDPIATAAVSAKPVTALVGLGPGPTSVITIELRRGDEGLELRAGARTDTGRLAKTSWAPVGIGHAGFELDWRRSIVGQDDGRLELRVDGSILLELAGLHNSASHWRPWLFWR